MKKYIFSFFVLLTLHLSAQLNLVQNYSFENVSGTLECNAGPTPSWPDWATHGQENLFVYWAELPPWTIPKMKNFCGVGAASADHYCTGGNTGQNFAETENREYFCAPLISSLISGQRYYVEFYIKATSALSDAGLMFSMERPKQCGGEKINIEGQPSFEIDNSIVFTFSYWTKVTGFYTPDDNYSWLTIGSFNKTKDDLATFAIDDIKIFKWVPECPDIQLLENWDYTGLQGITIAAGDKLYAGYNVGSSDPNGNVSVTPGSEISYKAGNEVGLFDGFGAFNGSEFHAYNAPCGSDCFPPSPTAGIATDICDGTPYQLGSSPGFEETYSWSSTPSNAINYLSSTTISNPIFTPPSTGVGTIIYTVTATNSCNQVGSNSVTIHYDNNPTSTVQLSLSNIVLSDVPSFDVNYDAHVKSITVEVLDPSLTTIYYSENFLDNIDFTCCSFPWELPVQLSPCIDYKIRVTATNYCTGAKASQIINWPRNRNVALTAALPNVLTPDGDGIDDQFCFQFTGASSYSFEVRTPNGTLVFSAGNVVAYPIAACSWGGECNQPNCLSPQVGDGTYYYVLTLNDCNSQPAISSTGFLTLLNGTVRMGNIEDSTTTLSENQFNGENNISVFPNPTTNGNFILDFGNQSSRHLELYNSIGQMVKIQITESGEKNKIGIEGLETGIYFLRVLLDNGEYASKQIIVL
ncbi:MAG: gliding motility-associated C-terminal domain-containing protein [Bacteroidetes bacterium]|jgi:hypothetical protein|nr:gliding motility-associated C-terminal domain-containing protein [Bacteroidota bacterium]